MLDNNKVLEILRSVVNPNTNVSIIDSQSVSDFTVRDGQVTFTMLLQPEEENLKMYFNATIEEKLKEAYPDAGLLVNFRKIQQAPESPLPQVKNVIAIASGKGGVGKSTVSANLAILLKERGYAVGLLDADLYGPSIPTMYGITEERPVVRKVVDKPKMIPIEQYGINVISLGNLIEPEQAVILRGPRLGGIIRQFIFDTIWPELDYLLIDLPPGTGDVQLTLVQSLPITGAIMVTTPQQVAVADALKAMNMFLLPSVKVPVLGVVENMSWFTPAELRDHKYELFGSGGGQKLADLGATNMLGQLPLIQSVREGGDGGRPIALNQDSPMQQYFATFVDAFESAVQSRNETSPKSEIVRLQS